MWWETHTEANYTNWASEQPADYLADEDCVVLAYRAREELDHYGWFTAECDEYRSDDTGLRNHALCKVDV